MSNWCNNYLIIEGDELSLYDFYSKATANGFIIFSKLLPVPDGVDEQEWKKNNWTAKRNPSYRDDMNGLEFDGDINAKSFTLVGYFRTNNVPPYQWLLNVQKTFPRLKFSLSFCEPLSNLVGELYTMYDENNQPYLDLEFGEFIR